MRLETKSTYILIFVTFIWGGTFVLVQQATEFITPQSFVFMRMILAAMSLLPFVWHKIRSSKPFLIWGGLLLSLLNATTYIFQTEGLQTIPASRSAFITGFGVVLVPLLCPLFGLGIPKKLEVLAVTCCVIGLYILTGANLTHLSIGDFWSLGCAFTYAVTIICLQVITKQTAENLLLTFYMTSFGIVVPVMLRPSVQIVELLHWQVILALLFCALLATSLVTYLMARYQKHVSVPKAAIIYALEPVFATLFAFLFYGQKVTVATLTGGSIIFCSLILPNLKFRSHRR